MEVGWGKNEEISVGIATREGELAAGGMRGRSRGRGNIERRINRVAKGRGMYSCVHICGSREATYI